MLGILKQKTRTAYPSYEPKPRRGVRACVATNGKTLTCPWSNQQKPPPMSWTPSINKAIAVACKRTSQALLNGSQHSYAEESSPGFPGNMHLQGFGSLL